jgi:hypothetical protein
VSHGFIAAPLWPGDIAATTRRYRPISGNGGATADDSGATKVERRAELAPLCTRFFNAALAAGARSD